MGVTRPARQAKVPEATPGGPHFVVAAAYEVLFMLAAAAHPRRYELARGWGAALQRRLSPRAQATWRAFFGNEGAIGAEPARLVTRLTPPGSVGDFVVLLQALPPEELALAFLGDAARNAATVEAVRRLTRGDARTAANEAAL